MNEEDDGQGGGSAVLTMNPARQGIHDTAKKRFAAAVSRWSDDRAEALDDINFYGGQQWDPAIEKKRETEERPCLTVNMLPQFVFQVTNEERQNKPSIRVRPFDSKADVKTAEKIQGLVRHIESNSSADVAYDTAFGDAVISGLGFFRIRTDYCNEESFDQDIFIERIENRFSVYTGPFKKPDASDMRWCFVTEDMTREDFTEQWPHAEVVDWAQSGDGDDDPWWGEDTVKVAEYWTVQETPDTLMLFTYSGPPPVEGMPAPPATLKLFKSNLPQGQAPAGYTLQQERPSARRVVKWYKMSGSQILEEGDFAGRWIPIVPVIGNELHIQGETRYYGLVRNAKDPQRMYNYWWTAETEMIALQPKAPWVGAEGQISGSADPGAWENSNVENVAYLEYKPITLNGQLAPPPQRQPFAGAPAGVVNARLSARDDMRSTTGIYDPSLGQRKGDQSGKAILALQREGNTATYHYIDNLSRAIRHGGRIVVDLIRHVYDQARVGRTLGEDGSEELVLFNEPFVDPDTGETVLYDLTVGEYDVVVSMGPAYATQRQEAADIQTQLVQANPKLLEVGGDVIMRNIDGPGMQELADRLERTIPPEILGRKPGEKDGKPTAAVMAQQVAAAQKQIQALSLALEETTKALTDAQAKLESNADKLALDREKAYLDSQTQLEIAALKASPTPEVMDAISNLARQLDLMRISMAESELRTLEPGAAAPPAAGGLPPTVPEGTPPAPPEEDGGDLPPEPGPIPGSEPPPAEPPEVPPETPAESESA